MRAHSQANLDALRTARAFEGVQPNSAILREPGMVLAPSGPSALLDLAVGGV